jgi:hypothetical protein
LHGHEPYGNKIHHQIDAEIVKQLQHLSVRMPVKNKKDSAMMESQDQCLSVSDEDESRLFLLLYEQINMLGRYPFNIN